MTEHIIDDYGNRIPVDCEDCGMTTGGDEWLDVTIPNEQWIAITGYTEHEGLLCGACIIKRGKRVPGIVAARLIFDDGSCNHMPVVEHCPICHR